MGEGGGGAISDVREGERRGVDAGLPWLDGLLGEDGHRREGALLAATWTGGRAQLQLATRAREGARFALTLGPTDRAPGIAPPPSLRG